MWKQNVIAIADINLGLFKNVLIPLLTNIVKAIHVSEQFLVAM